MAGQPACASAPAHSPASGVAQPLVDGGLEIDAGQPPAEGDAVAAIEHVKKVWRVEGRVRKSRAARRKGVGHRVSSARRWRMAQRCAVRRLGGMGAAAQPSFGAAPSPAAARLFVRSPAAMVPTHRSRGSPAGPPCRCACRCTAGLVKVGEGRGGGGGGSAWAGRRAGTAYKQRLVRWTALSNLLLRQTLRNMLPSLTNIIGRHRQQRAIACSGHGVRVSAVRQINLLLGRRAGRRAGRQGPCMLGAVVSLVGRQVCAGTRGAC